MPNWCYTKLSVEGEAAGIAALKAECFTGGALDFDRIVPMPAELDLEESSTGSIGYQVLAGDWQTVAGYPWVADHGSFATREALIRHFEALDAAEENPELHYLALGRRYLANQERFGYTTWYRWRIAHWGTKWNVYPHAEPLTVDEPCALELNFDTAWSPALPILAALTERYPALAFEMAYADEGAGFAGVASAQGGEVEDASEPWETVMADRLDRPPPDEDEDEE